MNGPAWHAGRITRLLSHLCNTWQSCDVSDVQVACLSDSEAHLALDPKDSFAIQTKPHGHGDVHALLHTSGLLKTWQKAGVKWVAFFQDTNGLVFRALPAALGALLPIPCLLPVLHLCSSTNQQGYYIAQSGSCSCQAHQLGIGLDSLSSMKPFVMAKIAVALACLSMYAA